MKKIKIKKLNNFGTNLIKNKNNKFMMIMNTKCRNTTNNWKNGGKNIMYQRRI